MKTEDLKTQGLTEEQINFVMAENGKDVNAVRAKLTTAETERDTYKQQAEDAAKEIKGYKELDIDGIKTKAEEWETKYNTDTQALQTKLEEQQKDFAMKEYIGTYSFTSELVKEAVLAQLKAKDFKLDNGKFLGADDFMKSLKEANPTAFVEEDTKKPPTITLPGDKTPPSKKLSMTEVMALKNANPDMDITPYL